MFVGVVVVVFLNLIFLNVVFKYGLLMFLENEMMGDLVKRDFLDG